MAIFVLLPSFGIVVSQSLGERELFSFVEKILQEEYVNPRDLDVPKIIATYKNKLNEICKVAKDCTSTNTKTIVLEMLNTFQDAHLAFVDDSSADTRVGLSNPSGRFGFFGKFNDKKYVVTFVYPESPAEKSGIAVGDEVIAINGKVVKVNEIEKTLRSKETSFSETKIRFRSRGVLKEVKLRGSDSRPYLAVSSQISASVSYIRIPEADIYQEQEFHNQIFKANQANVKNLVLDLRDNGGGSSVASMKMAAAFFAKPGRIMVQKDGVRWVLEFNGRGVSWRNAADSSVNGSFVGEVERVASFAGRVAILVSETTYSAGEHFVHLLQTSGKARVFGIPSAGALDSSAIYKAYPEGGYLYYGINRYQDLNGVWLPPRVTPDELVPLDLDLLTQGRDTQLEAALKYLSQ